MKLELDIFEFMKLIDSCWNDSTALSSSMLDKVMNEWFLLTSKNDRIKIYEWLFQNKFEFSTRQMMILARYNPNCQYMIYGENQKAEMFLFNGEYWLDFKTSAIKEKIIKVEKL